MSISIFIWIVIAILSGVFSFAAAIDKNRTGFRGWLAACILSITLIAEHLNH